MHPTLTRHRLVRGGLLTGLALTAGAVALGAPQLSSAHAATPAPVLVPRAVVAPRAIALPVHRASRGAARTALPRTRVLAPAGRTLAGYASWYGGSLQGRRTASGERFNTHDLTVASRTLPFGTRLRVCRRTRCVLVRVNDRGPYVGGRVLDLSLAARNALGGFGVAWVTATPVRSRLVPVAPPAPPRPVAVAPPAPTAVPVMLSARPAALVDGPGAARGPDALLAVGLLLTAGSGLQGLRRRTP